MVTDVSLSRFWDEEDEPGEGKEDTSADLLRARDARMAEDALIEKVFHDGTWAGNYWCKISACNQRLQMFYFYVGSFSDMDI